MHAKMEHDGMNSWQCKA